VKSSSEVKDDHIPDAAVQVHVLRRSGVDVRHAERRQRVDRGVDERRRNSDAAGLAQPLGAERIARRGRVHLLDGDRRHVVGAGNRVVHECPGQELTALVVHDPLHQGLAEPLGEPTVELALGEERVDDDASVVDPHQPLDREPAGLALDRDDGHHRAEAPRLPVGLEVGR